MAVCLNSLGVVRLHNRQPSVAFLSPLNPKPENQRILPLCLSLRHRSSVPERKTYATRLQARRSVCRPTIRAVAASDAAAPLAEPRKKIRIKLQSFWVPIIQEATNKIIDAIKSTNAKPVGPIPLPTRRRTYCLLRSPHVDKDSREHFKILTHQRLIEIKNVNPNTIDALMQIDIPAGVEVEVKLP
eukprot:TRINITY_DN37719_c0_g1_i1.p1 TRINITY_DN37719_c0_g1~~TRINITY_DN37719_c0_g1_i1.p1  ORF type:complete len:186 (-),score=20.99 TRINITY_DN37719_c0_g1_i1:145-702(-)